MSFKLMVPFPFTSPIVIKVYAIIRPLELRIFRYLPRPVSCPIQLNNGVEMFIALASKLMSSTGKQEALFSRQPPFIKFGIPSLIPRLSKLISIIESVSKMTQSLHLDLNFLEMNSRLKLYQSNSAKCKPANLVLILLLTRQGNLQHKLFRQEQFAFVPMILIFQLSHSRVLFLLFLLQSSSISSDVFSI